MNPSFHQPAAILLGLISFFRLEADPTLQIDAGHVTAHVNPMFYGMMTEEINHSYDGGLYAELIQNRTFQDNDKTPVHWSLVQNGNAASISLDSAQPLNDTLKTSLKLDASDASSSNRVGIANDGWWGIPVRPDTTYHVSFYAKGDNMFSGPLTASIESNDGTKTFATAQITAITSGWKQYTATLKTDKDTPVSSDNRFVISTQKSGTVWFNLVSLFPPTFKDRANGNRIDLMQLMADMKPAFLRCPGGNYLEGDTIPTRFQWKQTLGDLAQRPGHLGCWSYRSSEGLGLLEFMEWTEDLGAEPVLAVYAGYSLKGDHVKAGAAFSLSSTRRSMKSSTSPAMPAPNGGRAASPMVIPPRFHSTGLKSATRISSKKRIPTTPVSPRYSMRSAPNIPTLNSSPRSCPTSPTTSTVARRMRSMSTITGGQPTMRKMRPTISKSGIAMVPKSLRVNGHRLRTLSHGKKSREAFLPRQA